MANNMGAPLLQQQYSPYPQQQQQYQQQLQYQQQQYPPQQQQYQQPQQWAPQNPMAPSGGGGGGFDPVTGQPLQQQQQQAPAHFDPVTGQPLQQQQQQAPARFDPVTGQPLQPQPLPQQQQPQAQPRAPPAPPAPGATVADALPSAPPLEQCPGAPALTDPSRIETHHGEPPGGHYGDGVPHGGDDGGGGGGGGAFFSAAELEKLRQQPFPLDAPRPTRGVDHGAAYGAQQAQYAQQQQQQQQQPPPVVLATGVGMPVYAPAHAGGGAWSAARVETDGWGDGGGYAGVKSCDELLSKGGAEEIYRFLNAHNSRPRVSCRVHGYHTETRHRRVRRTRTDENGNEHEWHETETYYETITDFDYSLDLTQFIFP